MEAVGIILKVRDERLMDSITAVSGSGPAYIFYMIEAMIEAAINIGIDNLEKLFAAIRLVRCEAALYLSISASSPFLNNEITNNHSQRWIQFPKTPKEVPFFINHESYIKWIKRNIANGNMQNIRHLWSSIRPNGPNRPLILDRLELRVCDFVSDINLLLGISALLELRILNLLENKHVLTVHGSGFSSQYGKDHFRIVFLPSKDILSDAFNRIDEFLKDHR